MQKSGNLVMFVYSTEHMLKKDKVRFYYAFKGRDGRSGIAKQFKIKHMAPTVILVDKKHQKEISQFFKYWKIKTQLYDIAMKQIKDE
ncbi:hypothetical protein ACFL1H_02450 [Nanoarchaeota archaeon]